MQQRLEELSRKRRRDGTAVKAFYTLCLKT